MMQFDNMEILADEQVGDYADLFETLRTLPVDTLVERIGTSARIAEGFTFYSDDMIGE